MQPSETENAPRRTAENTAFAAAALHGVALELDDRESADLVELRSQQWEAEAAEIAASISGMATTAAQAAEAGTIPQRILVGLSADSGTAADDRRPTDELLAAAEHEASEDRRLAALMVEPRNRAVLVRRAKRTEALAAEVVSLRGQITAATELAEKIIVANRDVPGAGDFAPLRVALAQRFLAALGVQQ